MQSKGQKTDGNCEPVALASKLLTKRYLGIGNTGGVFWLGNDM